MSGLSWIWKRLQFPAVPPLDVQEVRVVGYPNSSPVVLAISIRDIKTDKVLSFCSIEYDSLPLPDLQELLEKHVRRYPSLKNTREKKK